MKVKLPHVVAESNFTPDGQKRASGVKSAEAVQSIETYVGNFIRLGPRKLSFITSSSSLVARVV